MINSIKKFPLDDILEHIYKFYVPNNRDNYKQLFLKSFYLLAIVGIMAASIGFAAFFRSRANNAQLIYEYRSIWGETATENQSHSKKKLNAVNTLKKDNSSFSGWLSLSNSEIDCPVYKAEDNSFYINHNAKGNKSKYGSIFLDKRSVITKDKVGINLVIYGNNNKDGSMFGTLERLRSLDFYKYNPTLSFATPYESGIYKIYAVFILNSKKVDDNGYIYNIYRDEFHNKTDFNNWVDEAMERSLVITGVDVEQGDSIITLVTNTDDFEGSRLVVMARKVRDDESYEVDTSKAKLNPKPKYPERWYKEKNTD